MMSHNFCHTRGGLLLAVLGAMIFFAGGCPGDRALFFQVDTHVLDMEGRPLVGEVLGVIPSHQYRWPSPQKKTGDVAPIDLNRYGNVYKTDPNGFITFEVGNDEPVEVVTGIIVDVFFPPSVKFLIMLPDEQPSGYAVTFVPGGDYEKDRLTYRHFDLTAGRALRPKYSDASGGLDITIHRPPPDPNNPWSTPRPSLHIRILTQEPPGN